MIKSGVIIGGRYEIIERIGTGGMADVYKATDRVLRRYVAMKVLKREFREDENFVQKFKSEARAAAGFTHPNIVNVYDVAEDRGLYYIVMELVEGITLKEYIQKKGKLTPKEVIGITMQVCSGIDSAHNNNIIHRDIKPQNIMISKEGKVKVTDFGIAKATSSNTISTNVMGSVHYTSPEQARGGFSDAKSDIYSLGITMYEMATGQLPFDGDSTVSIALKHLQEDIIPPSEFVPDMPYSLEQIILKCTQKSADRRYADVAMLMRDLKRSIQDPDGDFVKIAPLVNVGDTKMMTQEELEQIQDSTRYTSAYDDDEYDDYYDEEPVRERKNGKKSEVDPKMAKIMKILTIVAAAIFIGVMVGGSIWLITLFNGAGISEEVDKHVVPNMVGKTEGEAKKACEKAGLVYAVAAEEKSLEYDKGYVFKQMTQAGTELPEGAKVQVYVSTGLKEVEMPDLTDKEEEEAVEELKKLGLKAKNIKVQYEEHMTIKADRVTRTNPEAGEACTIKTKVTVYISKGVGETIVPDLVGKTKSQALQLLEEAGLLANPIDAQSDEEVGTVLEQSHDEGIKVAKGTTIDFKVSAGNTVEIPTNLVGKTVTEVEAKLKELGFYVEKVKDTSSTKEKDTVTSVQNAGKKVEIGSTIIVKYSVYDPTTTEPEGGTTPTE